MGDNGPIDLRRRYARPGEFEAPKSVLDSNSFKQRLGGQLNSDRESPDPDSRELPGGGSSEPVRRNPSPPAGEARVDVNQHSRSIVRLPRELPPDTDSKLRRNPRPVESEARVSVDLNQHSRSIVRLQLPSGRESNLSGNPRPEREPRVSVELSQPSRRAVPLSRPLPPGRELNLRRSPGPSGSEGPLSVDHPRSAVPPSRPLPPGRESNLRRSPGPSGSEGRSSMNSNQYRRSPAPPTSRGATIRRRTAARFELLPEPPSRWNRIGASAVAQLAFVGLLLVSPMFFPQQMGTALKYEVTELMQPVTHIAIPPATPPPPPPKPKLQPRPKPIEPKPKPLEVQPPKLNPKQPHVFLMLKPQVPKIHKVEEKPVDLKPIFAEAEIVLSSNEPKRPRDIQIKAPTLQPMRKQDVNAPSLGLVGLPETVEDDASKVQTGGFVDPHGVHGPANPNKAGNINQAGSPNLPGGPGYGNGTGGAQGARGTVASAPGPKSNGPGTAGAGTGGTTTGVAILSKPNPAYSTEARTIKLEGDVVLEVIFLASGQLQVIRVVSGLGHGLDEAAIQAAKMIRFRPAERNGQPVDFHAHVRIEFRLAD